MTKGPGQADRLRFRTDWLVPIVAAELTCNPRS